LIQPVSGKKNYYFGSLAAIYQSPLADIIGVKLRRLYAEGVATGSVYANTCCTIQQCELIRKKTKRGKQLK
jgi:hypothetical protein